MRDGQNKLDHSDDEGALTEQQRQQDLAYAAIVTFERPTGLRVRVALMLQY